MADTHETLTGVWNGRYDYPFALEPVSFMATLIEAGATFSGGVSETSLDRMGAPVELFAVIQGSKAGSSVTFTKTYDGSGGWDHTVEYDGNLSADGNEIEGEWKVPGAMSGRFLMIRPERKAVETDQRVAEKV